MSEIKFLTDIAEQAAIASQHLIRLAGSAQALATFMTLSRVGIPQLGPAPCSHEPFLAPEPEETHEPQEESNGADVTARADGPPVTRPSEKVSGTGLKAGTRVFIKSVGVWGNVFRAWRSSPGVYRVDAREPGGKSVSYKCEISDLSTTGPDGAKPAKAEKPIAAPAPAPKPPAEAPRPVMKVLKPEPVKAPKPEAIAEKSEAPLADQKAAYQALLELHPSEQKPARPKQVYERLGMEIAPAFQAVLALAAKGVISMTEEGLVIGMKTDVKELLPQEDPTRAQRVAAMAQDLGDAGL